MRFKFLVFLIILFISPLNFAQTIKGNIFDAATKHPIHHVAIYVPSIGIGTTSLRNGSFELQLTRPIKANAILQFSMLGYKTQRLTFAELKKQKRIVLIERIYENLDEIIINTKIKKKASVPIKRLADIPSKVGYASSAVWNNKIFLVGGDKSYIDQPNRRIMEESVSFEQFLQRMQMDVSFEKYSDDLQMYDIASNTWTVSSQKLNKRAFHRAVTVADKLFVLGGKQINLNRTSEFLVNTIEVYSPEKDSVQVDKTNPHQAVNFAAIPVNENIITIGGSISMTKSGEKSYSNKVFVLNTKTGLWYELPPMVAPKETNGIRVGNKIYLIGGFRKNPLTEIESFDLSTGTWTLEGDLFSGIANPALAASKATIYGYSPGKIIVYNTELKTLQEYPINVFLKGAELQFVNDKLYLFGGFSIDKLSYISKPSNEVYEINIKDFNRTKMIRSKVLK